MRNTKRNVAVFSFLRSILMVVVIITPCFMMPLPSTAALSTHSFTGSASVTDWVTLTAIGIMNAARSGGHTATLLNDGKVLLVGGYGVASAELYNSVTGTWSTTGSMNVARFIHIATLLNNGKVLVAGGYDGSSYLASAELYNPAAGIWSSTGSMNVSRYNHTATLLKNGKVLVAGGIGVGAYLASAELYDPATGTWSTTGSMNAARSSHTATLLNNGKVLVVGGVGIASAELYDPATGTWSSTGSMTVARSLHTATLLNNGKVLVTGGYGSSNLASAELYNPATGTWSSTGSMNVSRDGHKATLLNNGKVLVSGGYDGNSWLASAELYDPVTGIWSTTGSMNVARSGHTATLLNNSKVLVAGGYDGSSYLASAELATFMPSNTFTGTLTLPSGWISSTISAQFVSTSSAAAINAGSLSNDNTIWGSWITTTSDVPTSANWAVNDEGANNPVYMRLRDINGLVAIVVTGTVNVDLTPPTGAVSINDSAVLATTTTVTLTLSATDNLSGVGQMIISNQPNFIGASWEAYATSRVWELGSNTDVYVRFRDNVGNVSDTYSSGSFKVFLPLIVK